MHGCGCKRVARASTAAGLPSCAAFIHSCRVPHAQFDGMLTVTVRLDCPWMIVIDPYTPGAAMQASVSEGRAGRGAWGTAPTLPCMHVPCMHHRKRTLPRARHELGEDVTSSQCKPKLATCTSCGGRGLCARHTRTYKW